MNPFQMARLVAGLLLSSGTVQAQQPTVTADEQAPPPVDEHQEADELLERMKQAADTAEEQRDVARQTSSYETAIEAAESAAETARLARAFLEQLEVLALNDAGTLDSAMAQGRRLVTRAEAADRAAQARARVLGAVTLSKIATNSTPTDDAKEVNQEKGTKDDVLLKGESFGDRRGWSGALFKFAEKEKKVAADVTVPFSSRVRAKFGLTAPLDEETRAAALAKDGNAVPFEGSLEVEFDETTKFLNSLLDSELIETRFSMDAKFQTWVNKQKAANPPKINPNIDPATDIDNEFFQKFLKDEFCDDFKRAEGQRDCGEDELDALNAFAEKKLKDERSQLERELTPARPYSATSLPVPLGVKFSWGGRIQVGYDRLEIFDALAAAKGSKKDAFELKASAFARFYQTAWLAFPLSAGIHYKNKPEVEKFKRCVGDTATDTGGDGDQLISGQKCEDSALLLKTDATPTWSAYVELAAVMVPLQKKLGKLAPGFEFQERLEGIGDELLNRFSLGVFVTPTNEAVVTRFGVAVEHLYIPGEGDSMLTPVLLAGGSM